MVLEYNTVENEKTVNAVNKTENMFVETICIIYAMNATSLVLLRGLVAHKVIQLYINKKKKIG